MKKQKKRILSLLICIAVIVTATGCQKEFDAAGYTRALLHLTFQGDTEEAMKVIDGATYETLMLKYQESIDTFTSNVITGQFDLSEAKYIQFAELVAKIFAVMRYEVGEAEKTGRKEYEVTVRIQPADIFTNYEELLNADSVKLTQEINEGKYTGTEEEISEQILTDIVNRSYELLDTAYNEVQFGESQTVVLTVKADENNEYSIEEEDMNSLIAKILCLDEM